MNNSYENMVAEYLSQFHPKHVPLRKVINSVRDRETYWLKHNLECGHNTFSSGKNYTRDTPCHDCYEHTIYYFRERQK